MRWSTAALGTVPLCAPSSMTPSGSEVPTDTCFCVCLLLYVVFLHKFLHKCTILLSMSSSQRRIRRLFFFFLSRCPLLLAACWIDTCVGGRGLSQQPDRSVFSTLGLMLSNLPLSDCVRILYFVVKPADKSASVKIKQYQTQRRLTMPGVMKSVKGVSKKHQGVIMCLLSGVKSPSM